MQHALSKIDGSTLTATQITKSINLLTAIRWVKQAWGAVSADTIVNCFKHCGVQPRTDEVTDPFADLDEESQDEQEGDSGSQDEELQELVQQFDPELNRSDYINADEDLPTCDTYDNNENRRCELRDEILSVVVQRNRLLVKMTQRKRMRVMWNLQALSRHSEKL